MLNKDIRWIQRSNNYKKALARLTSAIELNQERPLSDLEEQGLIQGFEFKFDMGWKTLRDFVVEQGYNEDRERPIPFIVEAAAKGLVNEKSWRLMYQSRNKHHILMMKKQRMKWRTILFRFITIYLYN
jgi:hypothetical protein